MRIRTLWVAALAVALAGRGSPVEAASAEEKRLLVLEAPDNLLTKSAREALHAAIAEVATSQGLTLALAKELPTRLLTCDLPGCLPSIAAASGAIFVLRVDARFAKESFKLAVELWNSDEGKLLGKERRDCPICDEQDLWGSAALMTRGLLERGLGAGSSAKLPATAPSQPDRAVGTTEEPRRVPIGSATTAARWTGLGLAGVGAAALATGIYYWSVDGDRAHHDHVRDTRKLGLPLTIAGGAALLGGATLFGWSLWSGRAAVAVGPGRVNLTGRF
jgi:hypothetical protein